MTQLIFLFGAVATWLTLHHLSNIHSFVDHRKNQIREGLSDLIAEESSFYPVIQSAGKNEFLSAVFSLLLSKDYPGLQSLYDEIITLRKKFNKNLIFIYLAIATTIVAIAFAAFEEYTEETLKLIFLAIVFFALSVLVVLLFSQLRLNKLNLTSDKQNAEHLESILAQFYKTTFKDRYPNNEVNRNPSQDRYESTLSLLNDWVIENDKEKDTISLLDVGCGDGVFETLVPTNIQVTAIDVSIRSIDKAKERLRTESKKKIDFINRSWSDQYEIDSLIDKKYDVIIALEFLEHNILPATRWKELKNLLTPGGLIIATVPNISNATNLKIAKSTKFGPSIKINGPDEIDLNADEIKYHVWIDPETRRKFPHRLYSKSAVLKLFRCKEDKIKIIPENPENGHSIIFSEKG